VSKSAGPPPRVVRGWVARGVPSANREPMPVTRLSWALWRCPRHADGFASCSKRRAAAASVAAATATGVWTRNAWVVSSTSPAYTPTSSPVTIAYARVWEMIRSMSYSRYFRIATPAQTAQPRLPSRSWA
jgi:hypothetical protein